MDMRLITCIHGRLEITKAWFIHLDYLRATTGLRLPVTACYSDKADYYNVKAFLRSGDELVRHENKPLGAKFNFAAKCALERKEDRFLIVGSDDFLASDYITEINKTNSNFAGVNQAIVYSPMHKKAVKWVHERPINKTIGSGRLLSRKAFDKGVKKFYKSDTKKGHMYENQTYRLNNVREIDGLELFEFWPNNINAGLDNATEQLLANNKFKAKVLEHEQPQMVCVKSFENIHSFEEYDHMDAVEMDVVNDILKSVSF